MCEHAVGDGACGSCMCSASGGGWAGRRRRQVPATLPAPDAPPSAASGRPVLGGRGCRLRAKRARRTAGGIGAQSWHRGNPGHRGAIRPLTLHHNWLPAAPALPRAAPPPPTRVPRPAIARAIANLSGGGQEGQPDRAQGWGPGPGAGPAGMAARTPWGALLAALVALGCIGCASGQQVRARQLPRGAGWPPAARRAVNRTVREDHRAASMRPRAGPRPCVGRPDPLHEL